MNHALLKAKASARRLFGDDVDLVIARCPAWGCDDCCILVYGKQHVLAARAFAAAVPGASVTSETSSPWRGRPAYTYSVVTFNAEKEIPA